MAKHSNSNYKHWQVHSHVAHTHTQHGLFLLLLIKSKSYHMALLSEDTRDHLLTGPLHLHSSVRTAHCGVGGKCYPWWWHFAHIRLPWRIESRCYCHANFPEVNLFSIYSFFFYAHFFLFGVRHGTYHSMTFLLADSRETHEQVRHVHDGGFTHRRQLFDPYLK